MRRSLLCALGLLLALAPGAWAQTATGAIYGTATDESGAVLAGATVTLSSAALGTRTTNTGSQGDFRFLNLNPGVYKVSVTLAGFTTVNREVRVQTGVNVDLAFNLKVSTVEETVTVTAETPIIDTKKTGTTTNLTRDELEKIPQARDPWAVLRTVPGVLVDRVNIAGNESGQQAAFVAKGASDDDTQWNIDGLVVTDMGAIGASPTYFDYDAFEEIQISTGGNDVRTATGGINLNFVTKRGTNSFHGGGRMFLTHDDLQSSNLPDELQNDTRLQNADGSFRDKADHIQQISDYGADLGGPLLKDKLWFYGSYGTQDVRLTRLNGTPDKTLLKSYNAKLNWQASQSDTVSAFWFWGRKIKEGRNVGFPGITQESDDFTLNQDDARRDGTPPGLYKLEWNHIFSPSFFMNAKGAYYGTGFGLLTRGDLDQGGTRNYDTGQGFGSTIDYQALRPQTNVNVDGNYFAAGLGGNHELKFGFGYRHTPTDSITVYAGRSMGIIAGGTDFINIYRDRVSKYESKYLSAYVGDTYTKDRLTLNAGLRFDNQKSQNVASEAVANPDFPSLLPALTFDGGGTGIEWNNLSPRVGLTYALDDARKTILRASYAHYAGQISSEGNYDNPIGAVSYLQYYWDDANGDRLPQQSEVLTGGPLVYYYNFDPANPGSASSPNRIDPNHKARTDDEFIVGIDRELLPNFALSAAYTYRKTDNFQWDTRNGIDGRQDYTRSQVFTGTNSLGTFTAIGYGVDLDKVQPGNFRTNRPDTYRRFSGVELSAIKRLANRWMARATFSYNDWTEHFDGDINATAGISDPTRTQAISAINGQGGALVDGGQVSFLSGGSGKQQLFTSVKWQVTANALVQLPWNLELAGAFFGRQGLPRPSTLTLSGIQGEGTKIGLAEPTIDGRRYANLWNVDLRLAKNVKLGGASAVLSAEAFNVLNNDVELTRVRTASSAAFNRLDEILSPRVIRFGLRFLF